VRHYPRPALERNVTAISGEPRLFMVAPDTKTLRRRKMWKPALL
jgi:hypothetical protein